MTAVLVVDDSRTVRRVVERTLVAAGYDVLLASDGEEALSLCAKALPDLALVDVVMPRLGGLEFCTRLRSAAPAFGNAKGVPIILMTARSDGDLDELVHESGASDAITKPFGPEALRAVTARVLARARGSVRPRPASEPPPRATTPSARPDATGAAEALAHALGDVVRRFTGGAVPTNAQLAGELSRAFPGDGLERLAERMVAGARAVDENAQLTGDLEHVPLASVLELLERTRASGVLTVLGQGRRATVCFREGRLDLAHADGHDRELRLGRYLLEQGAVDAGTLERVSRAREPGTWLGGRLVAARAVTEGALHDALVAQSSEVLYDTLRWRRGTYYFHAGASRPEAEAARLGLPVAVVLMEGLKRVDEWRFIEERIRSFDMVLRARLDAVQAYGDLALRPEERAVLEAVDGRRTVREIVAHTNMSSFDVCKVLFRFLVAGLIEERPAETRADTKPEAKADPKAEG